jgi:Lipocalin-like domain
LQRQSLRRMRIGNRGRTVRIEIPKVRGMGEPIFAFGKEPVGHFIFTAGRHIAFSIMRNPPDIANPTSDPDPDACVPGWYCAYFCTYTVDIKNGIWVTHVLSANIPGF